MQRKYAIFNPNTGSYVYVDDKPQLIDLLANTAWEVYRSQSQGVRYNIVDIDDNGWERWINPEDVSVEMTQEILDKIKNINNDI